MVRVFNINIPLSKTLDRRLASIRPGMTKDRIYKKKKKKIVGPSPQLPN